MSVGKTKQHVRMSVAAQKGGVGKTTTAANLACAVAETGRRVLAIDIDPQGDLTRGFGVILDDDAKTIGDVLTKRASIEDAIMENVVDHVDLVPSDQDLADDEVELMKGWGAHSALKSALDSLGSRYDFVIVDCPPALNVLTICALVATRYAITPVEGSGVSSFQAVAALKQNIETATENGLDIQIAAIVKTKVDRRRKAYEKVERSLPVFELPIASTEIPERAAFHNAAAAGVPLLEYAKSHGDEAANQAANAYRLLATELLGDDVKVIRTAKKPKRAKAAA